MITCPYPYLIRTRTHAHTHTCKNQRMGTNTFTFYTSSSAIVCVYVNAVVIQHSNVYARVHKHTLRYIRIGVLFWQWCAIWMTVKCQVPNERVVDISHFFINFTSIKFHCSFFDAAITWFSIWKGTKIELSWNVMKNWRRKITHTWSKCVWERVFEHTYTPFIQLLHW